MDMHAGLAAALNSLAAVLPTSQVYTGLQPAATPRYLPACMLTGLISVIRRSMYIFKAMLHPFVKTCIVQTLPVM